MKWKSDTVITISLWFSEVNYCIPLEKLKSSPCVFFFVLYCLMYNSTKQKIKIFNNKNCTNPKPLNGSVRMSIKGLWSFLVCCFLDLWAGFEWAGAAVSGWTGLYQQVLQAAAKSCTSSGEYQTLYWFRYVHVLYLCVMVFLKVQYVILTARG